MKKKTIKLTVSKSITLALTRTDLESSYSNDKETQMRALFDPIVKPSMKNSWERNWKSWFVTTNTVIDKRTPGKMKG